MSVRFAFSRPTQTADELALLVDNYGSAGYQGLQLKFAQYSAYIDRPEQFNEKWGQRQGIGSALIAGGRLDEQNVEQLRKLFRFGRQIGTERIVFCHGVPRKEVAADDIRRYAVQLMELGKEAEQSGLRLSLHHHFNQPVMYRDDFDLFFGNVKDEAVGLTIDTAHLIKSGIADIAEVISSFRQVIDNFHMKDFADGDWRVLGQGNIDFSPVFRAIKDIRYEGWMSADEESGGDIVGGMAECLSHMKNGLRD